jgi:two-component system chemotaxis sensor kinase CheA
MSRVAQRIEDVFHHTRELKNSVMSMRAQPVKTVFQRMTRLVRELSAKTAKKVQLEMQGENTEVDKTVIERLSDPITHIIRNSIDHGIEAPATRLAAGKKEAGTIRLCAEQRGGRIVIEITDDGAGINTDRVLQKAREKGLVAADAVLNQDEINNLIFLPGFSTAEVVSIFRAVASAWTWCGGTSRIWAAASRSSPRPAAACRSSWPCRSLWRSWTE